MCSTPLCCLTFYYSITAVSYSVSFNNTTASSAILHSPTQSCNLPCFSKGSMSSSHLLAATPYKLPLLYPKAFQYTLQPPTPFLNSSALTKLRTCLLSILIVGHTGVHHIICTVNGSYVIHSLEYFQQQTYCCVLRDGE